MHLRLRRDRAVPTLRRGILIAPALGALIIVGAACGGSPSASVANLGSSTTSSTPAGNTGPSRSGNSGAGAGDSGSQHSQIGLAGISVEFAQCMRSHGVSNFPDPNSQGQVSMSGVNPQSSAFQAAQRACAKYSPNGGKPPSAAKQQQAVAQALKFSECMRSHGITDFPDPQVSSSGGGVGISIRIKGGQGSNLNPNNPQFQAAQNACQSLVPFGKGAPSAAKS